MLFAVNLDPHNPQGAHFEVPLWEFGLPDEALDRGGGPRHRRAFHLAGKGAAHADSIRSDRPYMIWQLNPPGETR